MPLRCRVSRQAHRAKPYIRPPEALNCVFRSQLPEAHKRAANLHTALLPPVPPDDRSGCLRRSCPNPCNRIRPLRAHRPAEGSCNRSPVCCDVRRASLTKPPAPLSAAHSSPIPSWTSQRTHPFEVSRRYRAWLRFFASRLPAAPDRTAGPPGRPAKTPSSQ